jgi:hypothetical protein
VFLQFPGVHQNADFAFESARDIHRRHAASGEQAIREPVVHPGA